MTARTEVGLEKALMSDTWNSISTDRNYCTVIYLKMEVILLYSVCNGRMLSVATCI
jgi:hypothetical protein